MGFEYKLIKKEDVEYEEMEITIQEESVEDFCKMMGWDEEKFANNTIRYPIFEEESEPEEVPKKRAYNKLGKFKKKPKVTTYSNERIIYTPELTQFLKDNLKLNNDELTEKVKDSFDINITKKQVADFFYTRGLGAMRKRAKQIRNKEIEKVEDIEDYRGTGIHFNKEGKPLCNYKSGKVEVNLSNDWRNVNCGRCKSVKKKLEKNQDKPIPINNPPDRSQNGKIKTKKKKLFSEEIDDFIRSIWKNKTDPELRLLIGEKFGPYYTTDQIKDHRKQIGLVGKFHGRKKVGVVNPGDVKFDDMIDEPEEKSIEDLQKRYEPDDNIDADSMADMLGE